MSCTLHIALYYNVPNTINNYTMSEIPIIIPNTIQNLKSLTANIMFQILNTMLQIQNTRLSPDRRVSGVSSSFMRLRSSCIRCHQAGGNNFEISIIIGIINVFATCTPAQLFLHTKQQRSSCQPIVSDVTRKGQ